MKTPENSPLKVAIIDAFGAAVALNGGGHPKTEQGQHARKYLLPARQFLRLVSAAVNYGTPPASVILARSASGHTQSDASPSRWTDAEATLHMRNVEALFGFEVEIVQIPEGSIGRLMQLREYSGRTNLPFDEGELLFHAVDMQKPLITCSRAQSRAFRSKIYSYGLEAYELDHTCPVRHLTEEKR